MKLHKVRRIVAKFVENLAIDNMTVPYWGRIHCRQSIPSKAQKHEIQLFKLTDEKGRTYSIM